MKKFSINGFTLKIIACITMLIDHVAGMLFMDKFFSGQMGYSYIIMRMIGRMAFPIFAFLLVEGFIHTKDYKKYLLRMLLFALISIIPYNLAFGGQIFNTEYWINFTFGNVFWTLSLGLILMFLLSKVEDMEINEILKWVLYIILTALVMLVAYLIKCDRKHWGILVIFGFYIFRDSKLKKSLATIITFKDQWGLFPGAYLSLIPILLYNGQRGKSMKYFFYIFYPLHLLILFFIKKYGLI